MANSQLFFRQPPVGADSVSFEIFPAGAFESMPPERQSVFVEQALQHPEALTPELRRAVLRSAGLEEIIDPVPTVIEIDK